MITYICQTGKTTMSSDRERFSLVSLQVFASLPDELSVEVLRASGHNLHTLLDLLPEEFHPLALRVEFHSLASEGTLTLDCAEHSLAACNEALDAFRLMPEAQCLIVRWIQVMNSETNSALILFQASLHAALVRGLACFELASARIPDTLLQALLSSLVLACDMSSPAGSSPLRKLILSGVRIVGNKPDTRYSSGNLDHEQQQQLACCLADGLKRLTKLESLTLHELSLQGNDAFQLHADVIAPALQSLTRLTHLGLDDSLQDARANARVLSHMSNLASLELCFHSVTARDAVQFGESLQRLLNLTRLQLSYTNHRTGKHDMMKAAQACTVAAAIARLKTLAYLDLSKFCMPGSAIARIAKGISMMTRLQGLAVSSQYANSVDGLNSATVSLCRALQRSPLTRLYISSVEVSTPFFQHPRACRMHCGAESCRHLSCSFILETFTFP
jgi:hypothetical protein